MKTQPSHTDPQAGKRLLDSFPLNIQGIKNIGLQEWLAHFPPNPSCGEYQRIHEIVLQSFLRVCSARENDSELFYSLVVNYKICLSITSTIYDQIHLRQIGKHGYKYVSCSRREKIEDAIARSARSLKVNVDIFETTRKDFILETARYIKTNFAIGKGVASLLRRNSFSDEYYVVGDPFQKELLSFVLSRNVKPVCLRSKLFLSTSRRSNDGGLDGHAGDVCDFFFDGILKPLPESAAVLTDRLKDDLRCLLTRTMSAIRHARSLLGKNTSRFGTLLVTNHPHIYSRLLAAAWKLEKGRTACFSHGNPFAVPSVPGHDLFNGAYRIFDKMFLASIGEQKCLEYAKQRFPHYTDRFPSLEVIPGIKDQIVRKHIRSAGTPIKSVREIMYVGYSMDYCNYQGLPNLNTFTYLRFEISVLLDLRKLGFSVTYKAHPVTLKHISGVFDAFCDKIVADRFEDIYDRSDCIVFGSPFTTAFGFSLLTAKPIVLFNNSCYFWNPEIFELLQTRVSLVDSHLDKTGTLKYSVDEVRKSIELSSTKVVTSIFADSL